MAREKLLAIVSNDKEVTDLIEHCGGYRVLGVFDKDSSVDTGGVPYLGTDEQWQPVRARHEGLRVALAVDPPELKKALLIHYGKAVLETLISPDSYVSRSAELSPGCIVQRGVKILPGARIGMACKVNINATVHHDTSVGECCTLAPGCQLLGSVQVDDEVYVGAGAIVLPHVHIGLGATIGAGAVVVENVSSGSTVVGVPAHPLK